jgi:hypothetical protein
MSKTKGNVIDPLEVMDEMGTDALRFTLLVGSTPGNDMNLSTKKVEANRNFANKLWNAGRFVIGRWISAPLPRGRLNGPWPIRGSGPACSAGPRCGAPVRNYQYGEGRAADLRLLLGRVCRLVPGDRQAAACRGRRPGFLHRLRPWCACWMPACACCTPSPPL